MRWGERIIKKKKKKKEESGNEAGRGFMVPISSKTLIIMEYLKRKEKEKRNS